MAKKTTDQTEQIKADKPLKDIVFYQAVGRRKEATARVRLYPATIDKVKIGNNEYEKGEFIVNGKKVGEYFRGGAFAKVYLEPFRTTNTLDRFVTSVKVEGGGLNGQLHAVLHGIARALQTIDREKYRPTLKKHGYITRDPRAKQRRKAGFAHKARKKKQSPKR